MAIDPYSDVKNLNSEIGQPSYVELISVNKKKEIAILSSAPNMNNALNDLAYNRGPRRIVQQPSDVGQIIYSSNSQPTTNTTTKYGLGKASANYGKADRIYSDFYSILSNPYPQAEPCVTADIICAGSNLCKIDTVFVVDNYWRQGSWLPDCGKIVSEIETITNGNCRFGMTNLYFFRDGYPINDDPAQEFVSTSRVVMPKGPSCSNSSFMLSNPFGSGFSRLYYNPQSDYLKYTKKALDGILDSSRCGAFRNDAQKLIVFLTTDYTAQFISYGWREDKQAYDAYFADFANRAASCGVKVIFACLKLNTLNPDHTYLRSNGQTVANTTNGLYLEDTTIITNPNPNVTVFQSTLFSQVKNFIDNLCNIAAEECSPNNLILNGLFDTGTSGWTINNIENVIWTGDSPANPRSVKMTPWDGVGIASVPTIYQHFETIYDIAKAEDKVSLYFDIKPEIINGKALPGSVAIAFMNEVGQDTLYSWDENFIGARAQIEKTISAAQFGDANYALLRFMLNAPGFPTTVGNFSCYIDNILICLTQLSDACGSGSKNLTPNAITDDGLNGWYRILDPFAIVSIDSTDPSYWDDITKSLILNSSNYTYPRINLIQPSLYPLSISFDIHSVSNNMNITARSSNSGFNVNKILGTIDTSTISSFPHTVSFPFSGESNNVYFTVSGSPSSIAKIKNLVICETPSCDVGYKNLSSTSFTASRNGWTGGSYVTGSITLRPNETLTQDFVGLKPGDAIYVNYTQDIQNLSSSDCPIKIELISGQSIDTAIAADPMAGGRLDSVVQSTGIVRIKLTALPGSDGGGLAIFKTINICIKTPTDCKTTASQLVAKIRWQGIPRRPINIFNLFARIAIRNQNDPYSKTYTNVVPLSEGRSTKVTCDQWTRNDKTTSATESTLAKDLTTVKTASVNTGNYESVANKRDWYWAIPFTVDAAQPDELIVTFPNQAYGPIVESIEIFYLANLITPSGSNTAPDTPGPFVCSPDPAEQYEVEINYTSASGKIFAGTALKNNLYPQNVDFSSVAPNTWDTKYPSTFSGLKGDVARWQSVKFDIDLATGGGLDQCSKPINYLTSGKGNISFNQLVLNTSKGSFFDPCDASVEVKEIVAGLSENETQTIILPGPTKGTWTLTVTVKGTTKTVIVPWNATAAVLQHRLETLNNIKSGNVTVSGSGSSIDQFVVTFVNKLAGTPIPLMIADATNLVGGVPGAISTTQNGTGNERQYIAIKSGTLNDLVIQFNGETSIPIKYNATLDEKQSAIEAILTIGVGNVSVTGWTTDRTVPYSDGVIIDFIGALANTNVPELIVTPNPQYSITTYWHGGIGVNEKQEIKILATGGSFKLKVYDPNDVTGATSFITDSIAYNATAAQIKSLLIGADFLDTGDVVVTDPTSTNGYIIEFIGSMAKKNFKQIELDTTKLKGGDIKVTEAINGGSVVEKQKINIINASGGFFRLKLTVDGVTEWSDKIVYDTIAVGLQQVLEAHSQLEPGDVVVTNVESLNPKVVTFMVAIKRHGRIPLMEADYGRSLLCNPIVFSPVPPPPYQYPLTPVCEVEDLSCQSGPLLTRPCPGDDPFVVQPCCTEINIRESANYSTSINYQRDIFSPTGNIKTIRDMVLVKGLKPAMYNPYTRNKTTGILSEVQYSSAIKTGMSVILIEKSIDTSMGRNRVINHLSSHREILPSRMVWSGK